MITLKYHISPNLFFSFSVPKLLVPYLYPGFPLYILALPSKPPISAQTTQVAKVISYSAFPHHLHKLMLNPSWPIKSFTNLQEAMIRYLKATYKLYYSLISFKFKNGEKKEITLFLPDTEIFFFIHSNNHSLFYAFTEFYKVL